MIFSQFSQMQIFQFLLSILVPANQSVSVVRRFYFSVFCISLDFGATSWICWVMRPFVHTLAASYLYIISSHFLLLFAGSFCSLDVCSIFFVAVSCSGISVLMCKFLFSSPYYSQVSVPCVERASTVPGSCLCLVLFCLV